MTPPLLLRNVRLVTPHPPSATRVALEGAAPPFLRGRDQGALQIRDGVDVWVRGETVEAVVPAGTRGRGAPSRRWETAAGGPPGQGGEEDAGPPGGKGRGAPPPHDEVHEVDCGGRVLLPGFVDAHTHACWAGDRIHEWEMRLGGASYGEILAAGGGILSSVRAVRGASEASLAQELAGRLRRMEALGTTTAEVKSGYGLSTDAELRMLRAIATAGRGWSGTVVPTALLGHAVDPEVKPGADAFFRQVVEEQLPAVTREFPGVAVDAFCEEGAWPVEACVRLFQAARDAGHPVRVHTDQFNELGMVERALALGARSVDHLEASSPATLARVAGSPAAAVLLPASGFHLDGRYADGRALLDAGGAVVVATNWNPGSAPTPSIPFALALAVRENRLTVAEALVAVTWNAAVLLGLPDRGWVGPGARADLVLLDTRDEREVAHTLGENPVARVFTGGRGGT